MSVFVAAIALAIALVAGALIAPVTRHRLRIDPCAMDAGDWGDPAQS